jgi:hypothetical protein
VYDISNNQLRLSQQAGLEVSVQDARNTPGALLFKVGEGPNGHVAISLGNGDTLETSSGAGGTRVVKGGANKKYYTKAALIPGVTYDNKPVTNVSGVIDQGEFSAPESANNINNDPAYQLAMIAALANGADPKELQAKAEELYGPATVNVASPTGGQANTPGAGLAATPDGTVPEQVAPTQPPGEAMPTNAGGDVDKFLAAIKQNESGGNYQARYKGPISSDAAGAYQMISTTWKSWSKGLSNAQSADQATPEEQDAVARKMAQAYYDKFGDWGLAAVAWYGGVGTAEKAAKGENPGAPTGQKPYFEYRDQILNSMAGEEL